MCIRDSVQRRGLQEPQAARQAPQAGAWRCSSNPLSGKSRAWPCRRALRLRASEGDFARRLKAYNKAD
eukprot:6075624-Alexandrium_andersonii.AAC.1